MDKQEIENLCLKKQEELMDKYFGNLVREAALIRPETIGEYTPDLPERIETEFYDYLKGLWGKIDTSNSRSFEEIINRRHIREIVTEDDREGTNAAYTKASRRTLWERITKSNYKDVTFYKGLLKVYTKELLDSLSSDFIEDVKSC